MSFEERSAVVGPLTSLLSAAVSAWVIGGRQAAGLFTGEDGPMLWARTVLWLVLLAIGLAIAVTLLFNLGYGIVTGENARDLRVDERDRLIGIRGMRATLVVASAGFLTAVGAMALGAGLLTVLNLMLAAFMLGELIGTLLKLALYRRGV